RRCFHHPHLISPDLAIRLISRPFSVFYASRQRSRILLSAPILRRSLCRGIWLLSLRQVGSRPRHQRFYRNTTCRYSSAITTLTRRSALSRRRCSAKVFSAR